MKKLMCIFLILLVFIFPYYEIKDAEAALPLAVEAVPYVMTALVASGLVLSNSSAYQEAAKAFWSWSSEEVKNSIIQSVGTGYIYMKSVFSSVKNWLTEVNSCVSSMGYYTWTGLDSAIISQTTVGEKYLWPNGQYVEIGYPKSVSFSFASLPQYGGKVMIIFVKSNSVGCVGYDPVWGVMWNGSWYGGVPSVKKGSLEVINNNTVVIKDENSVEIYRRTFSNIVNGFSGLRTYVDKSDYLPLSTVFSWEVSGVLSYDEIGFSDVLTNPAWNMDNYKIAVPQWTESEWVGKSAYDLSISQADVPPAVNNEIGTITGWLSNIWSLIRSIPESIANLFVPTVSMNDVLSEIKSFAMSKAPFAWFDVWSASYNQSYGDNDLVIGWQAGLKESERVEIRIVQSDVSGIRTLTTVIIMSIAVWYAYSQMRRFVG